MNYPVSQEQQASIVSYISQLQENGQSIGFRLGVSDKDGNYWHQTYGKISLSNPRQPTTEDLFAIGSVSKSFTCLMILILEEQGMLSIDDPMSRHLPIKLGGKEEKILVRHLMSHSSGIPDLYICVLKEYELGLRADYQKLENPPKITSWEEMFAYVESSHEYITSEPGERFHYSDLAFSLLQYIIEKASGMSYYEFAKTYLFDPLEMQHSTVRNLYMDQPAASGHLVEVQTNIEFQEVMPSYPVSELLNGGGGIMASTKDMQNYMLMMLNGGQFKDHRIITQERFDILITPHVTIDPQAGTSYALGWVVIERENHKIVFHTGHTGAVTTTFGFKDDAGIFLSNNISHPPLPVFLKIGEILGVTIPLSSPRFLNRELTPYVGKYTTLGGLDTAEVYDKDSHIWVRYTSAGVYTINTVDQPLLPDLDADGQFNGKYYVNASGTKTRVLLETNEDGMWLTISIKKFLKRPE